MILKRFFAVLLSAALVFNTALPIFAEGEAEETTAVAETTDISVVEEPIEAEETVEEPYEFLLDGAGKVVSATEKHISPAVTLYSYETEKGSLKEKIFTAVIDKDKGGIVRGVSLGTRFGGRTGVSALKNENGDEKLVAAVNADFFSTATGVPMGVFMSDGRFVSSSDNRAAIGFDKKGNAFIGYVEDYIMLTHAGENYPIDYLNKYPTVFGVYLLTRDFGETTYLSETVHSTEYIIKLSRDIEFGTKISGKVTEIRRGVSNGEIPEDHVVLVVPDAYQHAGLYTVMDEGDKVYITAKSNELFEDAVNAIGGGDILVKDGEIQEGLAVEDIQTQRHPRTAVGITEDGKIIMTVVDGRQSSHSHGLSLTDLARLMIAEGAVHALNFDGGGSSTFVLFGEEKATVINKPSDKTERKVPNALAAFVDTDKAEDYHILNASVPHSLTLSGAKLPISLEIADYFGETVEFTPTEENITVSVDERLGTVEFIDGALCFVGNKNGYGNIRISAEYKKEILSAEIYLSVTEGIDTLAEDESLLIADTDGKMQFNVKAESGGKEVYFGDMLGIMCENNAFITTVDGGKVSISLIEEEAEPPEETTEVDEEIEETTLPEETEETTEVEETIETIEETEETEEVDTRPEAEHGRVAVYLLDKTVVIPAYFDNNLFLSLDSLLKEGITLSDEELTVKYKDNGGVKGDGAFVISPIKKEVEAEETAEVPETTEVVETTEIPETTDITEETENVEEAAETPVEYTVSLLSNAIASRSLSGRRIWLWVDGLEEAASPYAVFEVTDKDGFTRTEEVFYERFYDFTAFNNRALLTLVPTFEDGEVASLVSPFVYTTFDKSKSITVGSFIMSEELDTNLYKDTEEHWGAYYVNSLSYMQIVGGSEDLFGNLVFRPDDKLTREQFAKILVNFLKLDVNDYSETELEFADNEEISEWAVPFVKTVLGASLMRGRSTVYDTIVFAPKDPITREEAFFVLGGLIGEGDGNDIEFADWDNVYEWAKANFEKLCKNGIVGGYDDMTVRPKNNITRAEAATVVIKIFDLAVG